MMDLVADTRRMAYGSMADQLNFLAEEAPLGAAELKMVMDLGGITPGMVLSSGLNVYYVTGVDPSTAMVRVFPTYDNSHSDALPVGSPVMIRPRVTDWHLFNLLNKEIVRLSSPTSGLFREGSWEVQNSGYDNTFDIPLEAQGMTNLIRAAVRDPWGRDAWYDLPPNSVKWQPQNNTIRISPPNWNDTYYGGWGGFSGSFAGSFIKFDYRAPFVQATGLTADVEADCGLAPTMVDIPTLGAAITLLRTTESRRMNIHAQGDPRRPEEVPMTGNSTAARELEREYRQRINDEYIRQINRNPIQQGV
jgi:hypothetical protein